MPRVTPITGTSDVSAEHHAVVDSVTKVFGGVRGPFSMLLHSPKLAERVLGLVTFFRDEIALAICGSTKSLIAGMPMLNLLLPAATAGVAAVPLILFHQLQLITCAALARRYAMRVAGEARAVSIDIAARPAHP